MCYTLKCQLHSFSDQSEDLVLEEFKRQYVVFLGQNIQKRPQNSN